MKALTLTQPWATLVAIGAKHVETRSWNTNYRGRIAIHAAKGFPPDAVALVRRHPFREALGKANYVAPGELPRGSVIALATLADVVRTETWHPPIGSNEDAFGDFSDGRFAWMLTGIEWLSDPVPARGSLGLWDWAYDPTVGNPSVKKYVLR